MNQHNVNYSDKVHGTSITYGWLIQSLRENDSGFIEKHLNKCIFKITSSDANGGNGLISIVLRCQIYFINEPKPYTTILKIPGTSSMEKIAKKCSNSSNFLTDSFVSRFPSMHQTECDFYNLYSNKFTIPTAKVFKTQSWDKDNDGCIHMEDLTCKGKLLFPFKSVNTIQIKEMTKYLAQMHKVSLTMDSKWKGKYLKNQSTFADMVHMITSNIDAFLERGKNYENQLKPLIMKYKKLMSSSELISYAHSKAHLDVGLDSVMVHGDLWLGNILWKIDGNGDITNHISSVIDWQIMHEGNPMADLARFLISCADGVVRRETESFILQYYLDCLSQEFEKDGLQCPFKLKQIQEAYEHVFIAMGFILIPAAVITINSFDPSVCSGRHKDAVIDIALIRALHSLQDIDRLIETKYKHIYDMYGI